jgi:hypothetical protein
MGKVGYYRRPLNLFDNGVSNVVGLNQKLLYYNWFYFAASLRCTRAVSKSSCSGGGALLLRRGGGDCLPSCSGGGNVVVA